MPRLTGSIRCPSIHDALLGLLGKPVEESSVLVIPNRLDPDLGYGTSTSGGQRVAYYDPMAGGVREVSYASFISQKEEFRVVG